VKPLVLASASPRREELLRQIGLEFEVVPSQADEPVLAGLPPSSQAERLALEKARAVAARRSEGLVIGADTVVALDGRILDKPRDPAEARAILRELSGREHRVTTGVAVVDASTGKTKSDRVTTRVRFAFLSEEVIDRYVATGEPMDKAGAYGIQGGGALLIESISGCYTNVVGLPLRRLAELLHEFDYDAFFPPSQLPESR
jgi:septum formation protein